MNLKTAVLAIILATGIPVAAQAQDADTYENYQLACDSGAECNSFDVNYEEASEEKISQTRRTRTRRTRSSSVDNKYYAGGTLGIFFPSEIDDFQIGIEAGTVSDLQTVDPGTGFGGSLYGGYKFSEFISADVEGFVFGGDADPLDSSYTSYGFFVNPRFTYTLNPDESNSVYLFASPGIGIAGVDFGDEISDAPGVEDASGTGFALQAKVGAGYPVSDTIDLIGQARYFYAFDVVEVTEFGAAGQVTETNDQGFDAFSIEVGANFKF